jgi:hypothetical protein
MRKLGWQASLSSDAAVRKAIQDSLVINPWVVYTKSLYDVL